MASSQVQLESKQTFSKSLIWDAQRLYYDTIGIDAWAGDVPCYITTNPFIANHYASIVTSFIDDWLGKSSSFQDEPFYCVEIGAGHGQFGFYFLKQVQNICAAKGIDRPPICYVMTDFTSSNIDFWKQHKALQPFVEQGLLDFAQFDFENDQELHLINQQRVVSCGDIKNPVIVFANYLFDSIVTDVFHINDGQIEESQVSLSTGSKNIINNNPKDWNKVDFKFDNVPAAKDYYNNPDFDSLLNSYADLSDDTYLQFPIGSLRGLENLKRLANNKMLLLSSDKGYVSKEEIDELEAPELAFHGSFSLMVNFHALGEYCKSQHGDYKLPFAIDGFVSGMFLIGLQLADLPATSSVQQHQAGSFGPAEFFCFYEHMEPIVEKQPLKTIAAYLSLSRWDPYIYEQVGERINDLMDDADMDVVQYIRSHLPMVADNFYFLPDSKDILFDIGVFYHEAENYEKAISFYERSLEYFSPSYALHFNWGYSLYHCQQLELAKNHFELALQFEPKDTDAKEWLVIVNADLIAL
jgi:tetratricopeptide (TPR) repeat protein